MRPALGRFRISTWLGAIVLSQVGSCRPSIEDHPPVREEAKLEALATWSLEEESDASLVAWYDTSTILLLTPDRDALRRVRLDGTEMSRLGRRGRGPGEFLAVSDVAVLPDGRVVVIDPTTARLTIFGRDGRAQKVFPLSSGPWRILRAEAGRVTLLAGGLQAMVQGYSVDEIDLEDGAEAIVASRVEPFVPEGQADEAGALPRGQSIAMLDRDHLYVVDGSTRAIGVAALQQSTYRVGRTIGTTLGVERITGEEEAELRSRMERLVLAGGSRANSADAVEEAMHRLIRAPRLRVALWSARVDAVGRLWVMERSSSDSTRCEIFDPDGRTRGVLWFPGKVFGYALAPERVVVLTMEPEGERTVRTFRVR